MEDVKTSIRVGDGPEVAIDLAKDINDPANADAKEQMGKIFTKPVSGEIAADRLRLFIERIERLTSEKKDIADDISDVFKEAKGQGFDVPTMRRVIALRKMETHARQEAEALLATYCDALGMTPIEAAILKAA